ncbi:hypothetical protein [Oribacterium sp. P6A1]|uniref:hypothetical protein n=1 Tax=Oribacterium sp. P6A1 TaxID=1410612 RepID=UPI00068D9881|nr:hypothetical protein [Oribacterium sp. P6A1]
MKNYLEHEIEVKYIDGILAKSQEWQWFIEIIENDYDLDDISTNFEFQQKNAPLRRLIGYFLKILEVSDRQFDISKPVLSDIYNISRFSIGAMTVDSAIENITTNIGKILFVVVWLTKIENSDNETNYITDMRFLTQKNLFQAINMQSYTTEEDSIIRYLDAIKVEGFDASQKCIIDNLRKVPYGLSEGFFEKYEQNLVSANAFNYQMVQKQPFLTWQEDTLLDMLAISIKKRTISSTCTMGNMIVPDYTTWTSNLITQLKFFFNNPAADFVLESIDYIRNSVIPSKIVVDTHCRLLKELIEDGDDYNVYSSSSYTVIASMFMDGAMKSIEKNGDVLELIKCVQKVETMTLLLRFKDDCIPMSKEQIIAVKKYIIERYKSIKDIEDIHYLNDYFSNSDIAKNITQEYYDMVMPKFLKMLNTPRHQLIPTLFYQAMLFLIEVNQTNQNVDRRIVKRDMIGLQEYWQNNVYEEQCKNLLEFKYSTSVASKDINMFNDFVLANPILVSQKCLLSSTDDMIEVMRLISEHAVAYMFKKMVLSPIYPLEGAEVDFDNHDIDILLKKQIEEIKDKYGYKFLNRLDTEIYVSGIHERYRQNAAITIPMFHEEKKLYGLIEEILNIKLISLEEEIQLGHLTQLFPLLEIQVRKLGKMFGIVPFKEKASEFMKLKDPS